MNTDDQIIFLQSQNDRLHKQMARQERRVRALTACLALFPLALIMIGASRRDEEVTELIRAKRVEIVDADGNVRVVLGEVSPRSQEQFVVGGNGLAIFDDQGNQRMRLSATKQGEIGKEGIVVFNREGSTAATVSASSLGAGFGAGKADDPFGLLSLQVIPSNAAIFTLRPENGNGPSVQLFAQKDEGSALQIRDKQGQSVFKAP